MGFPKGLLPWTGEGNPLLIHQIERFFEYSLALGIQNHIVLVLGYHHERYQECLLQRKLPGVPLGAPKIHVVRNPDPGRGQFSSLQEGVKSVGEAPWAFLLPIDCPAPLPEVWASLWQARDEQTSVLIPTLKKKSGHPLLLGKKLLQAVCTAPTETRLDSLIKTWPSREKKYVEVMDAGIHANFNTPEDL